MAGNWKELKLDSKLFSNVPESSLRQAHAALENCFITESGSHQRFPGLASFATLAGVAPVYLAEWAGDLIAVSNSRVYRINRAGVVSDVTGVPLSGSFRPTFEKTDQSLLMAAGGPILRFRGDTTALLSDNAPQTTHIGYIDGYVLAIEISSGLFRHCKLDDEDTWNALDTFAANGKPDYLNALIITPYREIILTGVDSIEQFERLPQSSTPFFRRWATGEGLFAPYTLITEDQGTWGVNGKKEFVRFTGQTSEPNSGDIGRSLEGVDDWTDAWAAPMNIVGQKFILLQMPFATNPHGTEGLTFLYDYRAKKWYNLYGWADSQPARWPGWSYLNIWSRHFVGGNGKVLELVETTYQNDGQPQRMLGRTAIIDAWGEASIDNLRMRLKRGAGSNTDASDILVRVKRDNRSWSPWKRKSLGLAGESDQMLEFGPMGFGRTFQFEWCVSDNCPVEIVALWAQTSSAEQS